MGSEQREVSDTNSRGISTYIYNVKKTNARKVKMSYISRITVSSVSTGWSTFLPFYEDSRNDQRNAAQTDLVNLIPEREVETVERPFMCRHS